MGSVLWPLAHVLLLLVESEALPAFKTTVHLAMQVVDIDIDALERSAVTVAFGDLEAEEPGVLSPISLRRLFRLAQLTVQYLLHVQDHLAWELSVLKVNLTLQKPLDCTRGQAFCFMFVWLK